MMTTEHRLENPDSGGLKDHEDEERVESSSEGQKNLPFKLARQLLTFNERTRPSCGSTARAATVRRIAERGA